MMHHNVVISRLKTILILFFASIAGAILFSTTAQAASVTYPTAGDSSAGAINPSNVHITASRQGNGIYLEAPYAVVKLKYSTDSTTLGVNITDACYWASIDGGSSRPAGCRGGDVNVYICTSDSSGAFNSNYKNDGSGRCIGQDPAGWGGTGQSTRGFTFTPGNFGGVPAVNGYYNLFVVVTQNVAGLNGFKVGASGGSRVAAGFAATGGGSQPMSLVALPLSATGDTDIRMNFAVPCGVTSGSFNLRWFDADRGAAGTPQDNDIRFALYNTTEYGTWTSGELAFISDPPQSEDAFLGGQGEDRNVSIVNSAKLRVAENHQYVWHWAGVNNNNGVQIYVPYDEPDRIQGCPPQTASCTQTSAAVLVGQSVSFDTTSSSNYSWSGGGTPATGTAKTFTTQWSSAGNKTVRITSDAGSATCVVRVDDPITSGTDCPTLPNTLINVPLPNAAPSNRAAPSAPATSPNVDYYEVDRTSLEIIGTEDISDPSGDFDVNADPRGAYDLKYANFSPPNSSGNGASVDLDYSIFVERCPYDYNQGQVSYRSHWDEQHWKSASDPTEYRCSSGTLVNEDECEKTASTSACPAGYSYHTFTDGYVGCRGSTRYSGTKATASDTCSATSSGPVSCGYYDRAAANCPSGYTGPSSSGTCTRTTYDPATPYYAYSLETSWYEMSEDATADGTEMEPCWNRTYRVNEVTFQQAPRLLADIENPTSSTSGSALINVGFSVPFTTRGGDPMRVASRVSQLPYTIESGILRSSGGTISWSSVGGTQYVDVSAITRSRVSSGAGDVASQNISVSVEDTPSDLRPGDRVCWRVTVFDAEGDIDTAGTKSGTDGTVQDSGCSPRVVNWPYLKVLGNDVVAGGSFECSTSPPSATVRGRMRPGALVGVGSSAQLAIFATDTISGFTSVGLRQGLDASASHAYPPTGLSFSNTVGNATYGGDYGANDGVTCLPDYFAMKPDSAQEITGNLLSEMNNGAGNLRNKPNDNPSIIEYAFFDGSQELPDSPAIGKIPNGFRKVIYVDGTLTIRKNVEYESTSWTDRNQVPYIMFIARNINIASTVTRLDGVYVAQNDTAGNGVINTCSGPSSSAQYNACRSELVVNGALIARDVDFNRTRGTLRHALPGEGRGGVIPGNAITECSNGKRSADGSAGGDLCAAEVISFSPETYMVLSQILQPEDSFKLDSFINLAPNL